MFRMTQILIISLLFSTAAWADRDDWGGYHHDHRHHHYYQGYDQPYYREEIVYMPPVVHYVPQPIVEYVPVQPRYYAPPPPVSYYSYDQRSPQGLVGGIVGSVMGYELGRGDPLAAGIGAAAGAWLGNGRF